eukprot:m51a1_g7378 hypothetical protein (975) ;mRNA; f:88352-92158
MQRLLALLALAAALASTGLASITAFTASVTVTGDPRLLARKTACMPAPPAYLLTGTMRGTMYYQHDSEGRRSFRRIDYQLGSGRVVTELIDYQQHTRYLRCSSCQAESYKNELERFFHDPSTDSPSTASDQCADTTRTGGANGVARLSVSATAICSAQYATGKTIAFSNYQPASSLDGQFDISGWRCPAKKCNSVMNLALILDESGSIDQEMWSQVKSFAKGVVDMYTVGKDAVWIGIGTFSTDGRLIGNLQYDSQDLKATINGIQGDKNAERKAKNPKNVMILMTDGANNSPCPLRFSWESVKCALPRFYEAEVKKNLTGAAKTLKQRGAISIGLGVGKEVVEDEINTFADYYIKADSFDQLPKVLNRLLTTTCQDFPESPCGDSCMGFCGCEGECECPSECPAKDRCTASRCAYGPNGCVDTPVACDDGNLCTNDTCDPQSGCRSAPYNVEALCAHTDRCKVAHCSPSGGCFFTDLACPDKGKCLEARCVNGECKYTPVDVDDGNECTVDTCDNRTGVQHTLNCEDGDPCTDDRCVANKCDHSAQHVCSSTDFCQEGSCVARVGCVFRPRSCDDRDNCTYDTCDSAGRTCKNQKAGDNCSYCAMAPPPCPEIKCQTAVCKDNLALKRGVCDYIKDFADPLHHCNDGNPCTIDTCNATTGSCSHADMTSTVCRNQQQNLCLPQKCDMGTGSCVVENVTCTPSSPCFKAECDPGTGKCFETSVCDPLCQVCSVVNNAHVCSEKCPSLKCSTGSCNAGVCNYTAISCDDHDFCTIDSCDPSSGCTHKPNPCDDGNPCTRDFCNSTTQACNSTALCHDGKWCTDNVCVTDPRDPTNATCSFPKKSCDEIGLDGPERECFAADCSEKYAKCFKRLLNSSLADACGSCVRTYDPQKRRDTGCIGALGWKVATAAITGGVIAGIAIAAVAGFLIFAGASSYGTYKLVQMSKMGSNMAAHNNPMYKPSDQELVNPTYTGC